MAEATQEGEAAMKASDRMSARMERAKNRRADDLAAAREERRKARRDRLDKARRPAKNKGQT